MFKELELPEDVRLPTCDFCGKVIFSPTLAAAFDEGMSRAFQQRLSQVINDSLAELTPAHGTQQDLERALGLSRGYVSKLKIGKDSSPQMAALLGLLAVDPGARLKELETLWSGRIPSRDSGPAISLEQLRSTAKFGGVRRKNTIGPAASIQIAS